MSLDKERVLVNVDNDVGRNNNAIALWRTYGQELLHKGKADTDCHGSNLFKLGDETRCNVDKYSLQDIDKAIDILKYYLQFLPKDND